MANNSALEQRIQIQLGSNKTIIIVKTIFGDYYKKYYKKYCAFILSNKKLTDVVDAPITIKSTFSRPALIAYSLTGQ